MILRTTIRPDRFWKVISGKKKEHRIPFNYIELTGKRYEVVILRTSFSREALIELLSIEKDKQAGEYVLKLGKIKSTKNIENELKENSNHYPSKEKVKKKYIQECLF